MIRRPLDDHLDDLGAGLDVDDQSTQGVRVEPAFVQFRERRVFFAQGTCSGAAGRVARGSTTKARLGAGQA